MDPQQRQPFQSHIIKPQPQQNHHRAHIHQNQPMISTQIITDDQPQQHELQQQPPQKRHHPQIDNIEEVMQQLMILVRETQDTDNMVQSSRDVYQDFVIHLQTRSKYMSSINFYAETSNQYQASYSLEQLKRELAIIENVLKQKANELTAIRRQLIFNQKDIFGRLQQIQNKILSYYLPRWHHEQQLLNNGVQIETINLDMIQACVEKIVDIIWRIKNQIKGLQLTLTDKPNVPFDLGLLESFILAINKGLETLIMSSLVVEKQPPQVMKTNTRFTSTVRFLCGNKLNVQMINPTVKALILNEQNARTVIKYHKELIDPKSISDETSSSLQQFGVQTLAQPTPLSQAGVIQSPDSTINQISIDQLSQHHQTQHLAYGATTAATINDNSMMATNLSPDQSMSTSEKSPSHQQLFHQQHTRSHHGQQIASNQQANAGINNMTAHQQYGIITEIGYNPELPVNSKEFESSGEIINSTNILEYHEASGQMISHFKAMQLKKIKRTEKKGTESVMDEKFILLFFTEFRIADDSFWPYSMRTNSSSRVKRGDLLFHILAFSLPVVVIVHGNQEPHAWATVTWHNAFATPDEVLYSVPDRVPWRDLGHVLSEKFRSHARQGLSQHNLRYLASKVYRNRAENDDVLITWNQFSKEPLSDKSFTFWEWFHSILKLTKDHLSPLWTAERIFGFVGKKGCVDLLLGSAYNEPAQIGTFLLRFSETELGGITIAWASNSAEPMNPSLNDCVQISQRLSPTNTSSNVVMHLQPFVAKDLQTRSLADRIRDLKDLVYLYPNIPKDDAFEAYYTPINNLAPRSNDAYVHSLLVTTLAKNYPGTNTSAMHTESSVTPSSVSQSSPDGFYHEVVSMNEVMDPTYSPYESYGGDFNEHRITGQF